MKNHLKRIASPKTWIINRKANVFTTRPKPGAHPFSMGLPLGIIIRDKLNIASTMNEVKKLLNNSEVLVDGKRKRDHRLIVGLFDVLTFAQLKKSYRVIFDEKGRITIVEINKSESELKVCKIIGKTILQKGKVQYNLHDGKNVFINVQANVGDSVLLSLPKLEVKEVLPLQAGAMVFLTKGKHAGSTGEFKEIKNDEAIYMKNGQEIETAKEYLFVIGKVKDKPVIEITKD